MTLPGSGGMDGRPTSTPAGLSYYFLVECLLVRIILHKANYSIHNAMLPASVRRLLLSLLLF